ncbi:MAG: flagellar hook-associated protein FlgK [Pseudomonadota bacterium]
MAGNLLNIGKTGLFAAQAGLSTTGHNIANANVAGYSRQVVVQATGPGQNTGSGFIGSGTMVSDIKRYSDAFLTTQVRSATSANSAMAAYHAQINQVDNLLADPLSGLSPAMQDFFKGVQDVASNPASTASRQSLLSAASSLTSRFQGINGRLQEIRDGVNGEISAKVTLINSYGDQIAELNDQIAGASSTGRQMPNDLLDARDQLVLELNKQIKASVVAGDNNSITVSIGNGQPLVVGKRSFELAAMQSPTDPTRTAVGFVTAGKIMPIAESSLSGGELGGLLEFRSGSLDRAQNSLGRIAIVMASAFNDQHQLGVDASGQPGQPFFTVGAPQVAASSQNSAASTATVGATISDPSKLTQSDYKVRYDGANYIVTRLSDSQATLINPYPQTVPQTIDGVDFSVAGASIAGDYFLVRPTINGASQLNVAITDRNKIAAGAPIVTSAPLTNNGRATISEGVVDAAYLTPGNALAAPLTLTYNTATTGLTGFPPTQAVTSTLNGVATVYPAGTTPIPYVDGATYQFGGISITLAGAPANADKFVIGPNAGGVGDNRNMHLLGKLQTASLLDGGTASLQSSYAELVSFVGNKTREVQVNGAAAEALLEQATNAQQSVVGVNLDEEAANLLRYQQAYQASGKVMQIASTLFDTLLSLGR